MRFFTTGNLQLDVVCVLQGIDAKNVKIKIKYVIKRKKRDENKKFVKVA